MYTTVINMRKRERQPQIIAALSCILALSLTLAADQASAAPASPSAKMATDAHVDGQQKTVKAVDKPAEKAPDKAPGKAPDKAADKAKDSKAPADKKEPAKGDAASTTDKKDLAKTTDKKETKPVPEVVIENVINVPAETLVDHASEYLNKNVRFISNFHSYSSIALDYKPALRPAKTYLSFLVMRNNSKVPLSEMKLAMPIPKEDDKSPQAKLLSELKDGDQLEITGKVFAIPLDEPWIDVLKVKRLKAAADDKEKKASAEAGTK